MKKDKQRTKLTLDRQTIRNLKILLSSEDLAHVHGGNSGFDEECTRPR